MSSLAYALSTNLQSEKQSLSDSCIAGLTNADIDNHAGDQEHIVSAAAVSKLTIDASSECQTERSGCRSASLDSPGTCPSISHLHGAAPA
jgi:hypothetical protein